MSKAFDSLDHDILLKKLQDVGPSASALKWFNNYLSDRKQTVRIGSAVSDPLPIVSGVPQGSILGPLLFTFYYGFGLSLDTRDSNAYVSRAKRTRSNHACPSSIRNRSMLTTCQTFTKKVYLTVMLMTLSCVCLLASLT